MKHAAIIRELSDAAAQLGISVRVEVGSFNGGWCRINGEEMIMLNRRHPPERQFSVLANSLRGSAIDGIYLKPAVRRALEEAWSHVDLGLPAEDHDGADDS